MTSISETIRKRWSCRSYSDRPVEGTVLETFRGIVDTAHTGLFGNHPRFALIAMDEVLHSEWKNLGTYGVIKNARLYLAGMVSPAPLAVFDYGYCKETLILQATELGLATCWLGGTFAISAFGRASGMRRSEILPTVTPVGYAAQKRRLTERIMRGFAGSDHRLPWEKLFFISHPQTPLAPEGAGIYREALENVRLAPSASNKQPWRVVRHENPGMFRFYLSRAAGYRYLRDFSLQEIDMGIACCHFDLTVKALGLPGTWRQEEPTPEMKSWEYMASWQEGHSS